MKTVNSLNQLQLRPSKLHIGCWQTVLVVIVVWQERQILGHLVATDVIETKRQIIDFKVHLTPKTFFR